MTSPRHLVTVWNPSYAADALEAHLRVLLDWDARATAGTGVGGDDDVYVWWGKVRSGQRQQAMPHLADILALGHEADADPSESRETHLYLTDYRSLYVADITHITTTDPRDRDAEHVPGYYARSNLNCDCWFMLGDIRALVRDDLEGVAAELALLRNTRYHDRPVSMYGGMVDLPLLVSRPDGRCYFDERERELLTDRALWARFDAEQGGVGALEATLRDDHLGPRVWNALDASARRFLTMAERTMREDRRDPAADLSSVVVSYGKAIEVQVNEVLRRAMGGAPEAARRVKIGDSTRLLPEALPLSLGQLAFVLGGEPALGEHLRRVLEEGAYFTGAFAAVLDAFADVRNSAAHGGVIDRAVVGHWRDRMLGVGMESVVTRLAAVRVRQA
ncbi:MAG: hypothetical protein IPP90_14705 [Gemmatimonadaceae bacterium]|nr:hypothetical protein [Gemmatimonadaceae bacterium]